MLATFTEKPKLARLVNAVRLERIVPDASLTISCSKPELKLADALLITIMVVQWPFRYMYDVHVMMMRHGMTWIFC